MHSLRSLVLVAALLALGANASCDTSAAKIAPSLRKSMRSAKEFRDVIVLTTSPKPVTGVSVAGVSPRASLPRGVRLSANRAQIQKLALSANVIAIVPDEPPSLPPVPGPQFRSELVLRGDRTPLPNTWLATDLVGARAAWNLGYTGRGVKVAVMDEGVDFAHPDLQGTQARVEDPSSPYYGWPIVFDPYSMAYYAKTGTTTTTSYLRTVPTVTEANPVIGGATYRLPGTSKSGVYHWGNHPSYWLTFFSPWGKLARVLVADESAPGHYDTVYVDLDKDNDFTDEKPCRKGDEIAWHDTDGDGLADFSGGMVYFIADGVNPIPVSDWLYNLAPPANGCLVCFAGSLTKYESHGTLVASAIAAQGVIGRDITQFPTAGDGIVRGSAPGAKIISIGNVYRPGASMYDAVLFSVLGYDGRPNTGDEADIVNMSFGYSEIDNDGWDYLARYIAYLNVTQAPNTTFVAASGNGGPGYGTVTSPASSPTVISVGASTLYGSVPIWDEIAGVDQITHGDIQPWSNRGPSALGTCEPDVTAIGAWATGDTPIYGDGVNSWGVWGGTSLACPMACGVLADVYEAFISANGRKPTFEEARRLLMAGAADLGYPVFEQGSGQVDAERSVRIARREEFAVSPVSWQVGQSLPGFLGTTTPMQRHSADFSVSNPTSRALKLDLQCETYTRIGSLTRTVTAVQANETIGLAGPSYLIDAMPLIPRGTDLLRVRAAIPFEQTTPNAPSDSAPTLTNAYALIAYDWTDLNANRAAWHDDAIANGVVNEGELDPKELSRFSYDAPLGDCMEVTVSNPRSRIHDGLLIGLQHYRVSPDVPETRVRLTFEFYKRGNWDMLEVSQRKITLPPGGTKTFQASFRPGPLTKPGVYSGAIHVIANGGAEQVIPVTASVANSVTSLPPGTLQVWGSDGTNAPYDNGLIRGDYDWGWRPESGDWRFYFYDPPDHLDGARLLANVNWRYLPTDVDFLLYGPNPSDYFSTQLPSYFGPYSLVQIGGSRQTNLGGGVWPFYTNTGEASEWVSGPLADGMHLGMLHCTLSSGKSSVEPLTVQMGPAFVSPNELTVPAGGVSEASVTLTPYLALWQGVEARVFGFSKPLDYLNQPIGREPQDSPDSARWFRDFTVQDAGLLEIWTGSASDIDIDLYVLRDMNGDGYFDWTTELVGISGGDTSSERVRIVLPENGSYRVAVHGYDVRVQPASFDAHVQILRGTEIVVEPPAGTVFPGQPARFSLSVSPASDGEGLLLLGPKGAPAAMEVPIHAR